MYVKFCNFGSYADEKALAASKQQQPPQSTDVYKKVTFYRRLSAFLLLLCFVLLAVVVALAVTTQSSKQCPTLVDPESMSKAGVCNRQACEKILSSQPVSSNVVTACTECGKDWLKFEDSCYFLSRVRLTWQESRNECHKIGGDLVVISNERVQKFLTQKGSMLYWIGLNRSLGTEPWTWINNTSLITGYWAENLQNGNCVFLKAKMWFKKNWHLSPCTDISHYICQKA
ncbi:CD209 antigen-like protein C isoform X2 [Hoplias malabaricus]|uniref:CD209 antigen-like protein C isoform X2 n=1 Tax=Hoplias malabaricus TaxID=27720 RepID=UPI0034620883